MRNNPVFQSVRPSYYMDVLSPFLEQLHFNAHLVFEGGLCGPWSISATDNIGRTTFHLVTKGSVWLHGLPDVRPLQMKAGDLVLFPRDTGCTLSDSVHVVQECVPLEVADWSHADAALICGYFSFTENSPTWLLDQLPTYVHLSGDLAGRLRTVVDLLIFESAGSEPGRHAIMARLADGLFMYVIRYCMSSRLVQSGLLAGLSDKALRHTLLAIHREPAKDWNLLTLAEHAHLSRSTFSVRFTSIVGIAPMEYVTRWRMQMAARRLLGGRTTMFQIAHDVGYTSEVAFSKAFKRVMGCTPSVYKRRQ